MTPYNNKRILVTKYKCYLSVANISVVWRWQDIDDNNVTLFLATANNDQQSFPEQKKTLKNSIYSIPWAILFNIAPIAQGNWSVNV